jgi:host factor-I protein
MPITSRPHDLDGNLRNGRRSFRGVPEFKRSRSNGNGNGNGNGNSQARAAKATPPEATHAENFYYLKQMHSKTPMVVVLTDGEELRGCIEWYDKSCLKLNRDGAPNLLIQKHCIKYVFKQEELD